MTAPAVGDVFTFLIIWQCGKFVNADNIKFTIYLQSKHNLLRQMRFHKYLPLLYSMRLGMDYKTVKGIATGSFTEKKSEFIGTVCHAVTEEEAVSFIDSIRADNRKARHNVYAYILRNENISRYSDDGEPQGTGGVPVLEVIKKSGLTDVCIVVTRYFGGILLGTGGLARAYTQGAKLALENAQIMDMRLCDILSFSCDYSLYGMITGLLAQEHIKIRSCDFEDNVKIVLYCTADLTDSFIGQLTEISNGKINVIVTGREYADLSDRQ